MESRRNYSENSYIVANDHIVGTASLYRNRYIRCKKQNTAHPSRCGEMSGDILFYVELF